MSPLTARVLVGDLLSLRLPQRERSVTELAVKACLDAVVVAPRLAPRLRPQVPCLFPAERGGHLNLHNWRRDEWKPALTAAGLDYRKPYALRHTLISECIAAGIATFEVARMAGTSVLQLEKTYGHLLPDALDRGRAALEAFDRRADSGNGRRVILAASVGPYGAALIGAVGAVIGGLLTSGSNLLIERARAKRDTRARNPI